MAVPALQPPVVDHQKKVVHRRMSACSAPGADTPPPLCLLGVSSTPPPEPAFFPHRSSIPPAEGFDLCGFIFDLFLLFAQQVSGSALGMEGQVSVFHHYHRPGDGVGGVGGGGGGGGVLGPCYRCVFPAPLAAEAGRRCSDNGVLGTVPGERERERRHGRRV